MSEPLQVCFNVAPGDSEIRCVRRFRHDGDHFGFSATDHMHAWNRDRPAGQQVDLVPDGVTIPGDIVRCSSRHPEKDVTCLLWVGHMEKHRSPIWDDGPESSMLNWGSEIPLPPSWERWWTA